MKHPGTIHIEDYLYNLPDERIAQYPLEQRDASTLLTYSNGIVSKQNFKELPALLPANSLLVFNNTRVVRARMLFQKETGATIEIFLLNPLTPFTEFQQAFASQSPVSWECIVGNARKWKSGKIHLKDPQGRFTIYAELDGVHEENRKVKFSWEPEGLSLGELLEMAGRIPLPPYMKREDEESDVERYQTVFARFDGSVAAPTAGLHFTDEMFSSLDKAGIKQAEILLHVGAGTFKPVSSGAIGDHYMHSEKIVIDKRLIRKLAEHNGPVTCVGTTSARSLESVYWHALELEKTGKRLENNFIVSQWQPYAYDTHELIPGKELMASLYNKMESSGIDELQGVTSLMIAPGYKFGIMDSLITNFHQPGSTLLLLVAALIGDDWKNAYEFALKNDFRFLSYGDACLFIP